MATNVVDFIEEPICYSAFYEEYLVGNKPCLLSDYFTSSWPCRRDWVKDGLPNWKHLCDQYGLLFCKHNQLCFINKRKHYTQVLVLPQ